MYSLLSLKFMTPDFFSLILTIYIFPKYIAKHITTTCLVSIGLLVCIDFKADYMVLDHQLGTSFLGKTDSQPSFVASRYQLGLGSFEMSPLYVSVYAVNILILSLVKTAMFLRLPRFSFPKFREKNISADILFLRLLPSS